MFDRLNIDRAVDLQKRSYELLKWVAEAVARGRIATSPELREPLALCAYGADLFRRMNGTAVGPAALALWRQFAWLPTGSPKKKFHLTSGLLRSAERLVVDAVFESGTPLAAE